jgi:hypothetical protein
VGEGCHGTLWAEFERNALDNKSARLSTESSPPNNCKATNALTGQIVGNPLTTVRCDGSLMRNSNSFKNARTLLFSPMEDHHYKINDLVTRKSR